MMEQKAEHHEDEFTKLILSWSLDVDVRNEELYKHKVENIPLTFESEQHYFGSFVYPLLEETRSELASSMDSMSTAPFADILSVKESTSGENMLYNVTVGRWRNQYSESGKDDYYTLPGDLLLLVDGKPESFSDMKREGRTWKLSSVKSNKGDSASLEFTIKASQPIEFQDGLYAVFLMNITTQKRIWNSLHMHRNLNIVKEVLYSDSQVKEKCSICSFGYDSTVSQKLDPQCLLNLNESQKAAVMGALCKMQCCHMSSVEQIWGPPGTGKTMTFAEFLTKNKYATCRTHASISYKLHAVNMEPSNIVVIDESAQLKEAESTIPLQLPGIGHAILIGDECQLPALVNSNVCIASGFGRSLFDRLSSLGHSKHLLNVQYRMHPSISFFPYRKFYHNQILDAQNVLSKGYEKRYLSGPMFRSYSFINVVGGREEKDDDGRSLRNMVEVAVVIQIVKNLYRACQDSKKKLTVGVISPYAAQVVLIQEKLAHKYQKLDGFSVTVKSIDGFQGGEEDFIILSTVRSNSHGSIGFISCPQRTNVALTRARHCLWILGNERTLTNSESIWKELVCDAKNRHCLFNADDDECLKMITIAAMKELEQLDDLVNGNSVLFKHAKWKVLISDEFRRSFGKLTGSRLKKQVLNLLLKLSSGWRPKNRSVDLCCENSSQILKQFKVEGIYAICSIDIIKEVKYTQVLKVWDILALEDIPELKKRLESIYSAYTDDYISRCTEKCLEGNLDVPRTWPASQEIIRFRYLKDCEVESEASVNPGDAITYVENSKVSESLLLMKFYSLSCGVVSHLLSGKDVDLPMQVNDEQMDIILSRKSSFIIGRSGTGKTTTLTMKLFQHEHKFQIASDGIFEAESNRFRDAEIVDNPGNSKPSVLRQLFVTLSPRLCYAVKQHVSHLTRCASTHPFSLLSIYIYGLVLISRINIFDSSSSADVNLDETDVISSEFDDIADTFINIPVKNYPLVITFQNFLMMLDGTLESSFFERFRKASEDSHGNYISSRSVAMQTFLRSREVTFDKFCSLYWPHFDTNLTKKLNSSRAFTEIISHIKGGLLAGECSDGKVSYEGYCLLAKSRSSTLTKEKREIVYNLFQAYEKMKRLTLVTGKIYVSTCGKIVAAAECFTLAGCYSEAAEAYAKDDKISNCLSVCKEGKLYEKGLQYINYWKEHASFQSKEIQQIVQEFLESCALDYHEHKDPKSMMKFVRAFCSMESKRVFLRSFGCLDDLLLLEEESGHFIEAAELAR
ncbi:UvrD-like helicase, ATP-binding domain, P-loop containing nucleoside triphosphate hydrolase, partial [Tanacetum coccineum]